METLDVEKIDAALLRLIDKGEVEVIQRDDGKVFYRARRAPWSYQELAIAVGLVFTYQVSRDAWARAGNGILTRQQFIDRPLACALRPMDVMKALQAGIEFSPILTEQRGTKPHLTIVQ